MYEMVRRGGGSEGSELSRYGRRNWLLRRVFAFFRVGSGTGRVVVWGDLCGKLLGGRGLRAAGSWWNRSLRAYLGPACRGGHVLLWMVQDLCGRAGGKGGPDVTDQSPRGCLGHPLGFG
ncbi:MAG: hypothetical protein A2V70_03420 [Planctomycetes bacterium RBG_13_63_9]|nr:MAG: hypothetical protein A2V70_03420 [Planctomycetes bacterium RBG_13_63_9]